MENANSFKNNEYLEEKYLLELKYLELLISCLFIDNNKKFEEIVSNNTFNLIELLKNYDNKEKLINLNSSKIDKIANSIRNIQGFNKDIILEEEFILSYKEKHLSSSCIINGSNNKNYKNNSNVQNNSNSNIYASFVNNKGITSLKSDPNINSFINEKNVNILPNIKSNNATLNINVNVLHMNSINNDFKNLSYLYLSDNYIQFIPKDINNFKSLKHLDLSKNFIRKLENLDSLPLEILIINNNIIDNISNICKSIRKLVINNQRIIKNESFKINLDNDINMIEILECEGNNFYDILSLRYFPRLTCLKLKNNIINNIQDLTIFLKHMEFLSFLDLKENPVVSTNKNFRDKVILSCESLEELNNIDVKSNERAYLTHVIKIRNFDDKIKEMRDIKIKSKEKQIISNVNDLHLLHHKENEDKNINFVNHNKIHLMNNIDNYHKLSPGINQINYNNTSEGNTKVKNQNYNIKRQNTVNTLRLNPISLKGKDVKYYSDLPIKYNKESKY